MIAKFHIPENYLNWNRLHGAPYGRVIPRWKRAISSAETLERLRGPFALQPNNSSRTFEYPWAFHSAGLQPGMSVLEVGGGLAGFQFVLDQSGCKVVNIDPGMPSEGWPCNQESMEKLNRRFKTNVELRNTTIENAGLANNQFDRVFCISVIEHLSDASALSIMQHVHATLKPGGLFVLTADLFLNVAPFCTRPTNEFGMNQNLRKLIDEKLWQMEVGERNCLHGFPEFNPDFILCNLEKYLIGIYPALAQCMVLKKI
jgi:2-polyprenyl-3-methyl-5-hydroxy-6-metoxy-1,4-benzoquinol methylase